MNWKYFIRFTRYHGDDTQEDFFDREPDVVVLLNDQEFVDWFVKNVVNSCIHEVIVNKDWKDRD